MRQAPTDSTHWVLAFDATCQRCKHISEAISEASDGRLEVVPLANPDVRKWREQALGSAAPWAPTVIRVRENGVRAWTGLAMGARLAMWLGPRRTARVLNALGGLGPASTAESSGDAAVGRRGLLKLGAGVGVGIGLMLSSQPPAFAVSEPKKLAAARAWARANQTPRAGQYDEFIRFEPAYRQAVFADLPAPVRSELWKEQVRRFRVANPELTAEQSRVLDEADALLAEPTLYADPAPALLKRVKDLETSAIDAFGNDRACGLLARLGPPLSTDTATATGETLDPKAAPCECSLGSQCNWNVCEPACCTVSSPGCGCFGVFACDGSAVNYC